MNKLLLIDLANKLSQRSDLTVSDLDLLAKLIRIDEIAPEFLPTKELSTGTLKNQRLAQFELAEKLWGKDRKFWLDQESVWLKEMREVTGSTQDEGKDDFKDVVSVRILMSIYAAVYAYHQFIDNKLSQFEFEFAIECLNLALKQTIQKGYARSTLVDGKNLYTTIKNMGLRVGGSGLYLPDPVKNLPLLFFLFLPENINQDIYM